MIKIFIVSGDPSGDNHAARLMHEMKRLNPEVEFLGIGGSKMEAEGLESLVPQSVMSLTGFWEIAKNYLFLSKVFNRCKSILLDERIEVFIAVDYPGFNMRLSSVAKTLGIPVVYFIAPQLWAWRQKRALKLKEVVDRLLVVLPFEKHFFFENGINAKFVGHPILDDPDFQTPTDTKREKIIACFPGSRLQEVKKHIKLFPQLFSLLNSQFPDYRIVISKSPNIDEKYYVDALRLNFKIELSEKTRELMKIAAVGIVKTGTTTLEATLCGMPFAMIYKTSPFNYAIGKKFLKLKYVALPNIILNKETVKEFIQNDANSDSIFGEIRKILTNDEYRLNMLNEFRNVRESLGEKGASAKAAKEIIKLFN